MRVNIYFSMSARGILPLRMRIRYSGGSIGPPVLTWRREGSATAQGPHGPAFSVRQPRRSRDKRFSPYKSGVQNQNAPNQSGNYC